MHVRGRRHVHGRTHSRTHSRTQVRTLVAVALVAVVSACTPHAPIAPGAAGASPAASGGLFPLVRDVPSDGGTAVRRVGFVDGSGQLVVRPTYRAWLVCPDADGTGVVLAWGDGQLHALDATGATAAALDSTTAGTEISDVACGPLPGYATVGTGAEHSVVTVPDLTASDLPPGVGMDDSTVYVPPTGQGRGATAPYLEDAPTGTQTTLPSDFAGLVPPDSSAAQPSTGEWPVPALDTKGKQRYLDKSGAWASTQTFTRAGGFVHGYGWVSTGTSWHFVDTTLTKTGQDWTSIVPLLASDGHVTGYQVTSAAGGTRTGLVTPDLEEVVDPGTESATCRPTDAAGASETTTCVASAADGTARLVVLPEGTSTPLPDGFTTPLSDRTVTDATGSQVHDLTTGTTFAVPAPYHAEAAWGDAYVVASSDNGLRVVLDGSGATTGLGTITGQVVAADGTAYFWATAGDRQGYVDAAGRWLYDEARYTALED